MIGNNIIKKVTFNVGNCILAILVLFNLLFWGFAYVNPLISIALSLLYSCIVILMHKSWCTKFNNASIILVSISLLFVIFVFFKDGPFVSIAQLIPFVIGIIIFQLKDIYKYFVLRFITKCFGILLFFSSIAYIIFLINPAPTTSILSSPYNYEDHFNYIFFILPVKFAIPRFSGPFIEPGHLSIFCVFITYANRYNLKKNKILWVYIVCIILSFSLAGYILFIIGYLFNTKLKLSVYLTTIIVVAVGYIGVSLSFDSSDNPVDTLILSRLEYDDEKGISGNNRTHGATELYLDKLTRTGDIIFGIGPVKFGNLSSNNILSGAGYKVYLIQYGIIGMVLALGYYLTIAYNYKYNQYSLKFFIFVVICCLQRMYPDWISWMIPYICSFYNYSPPNKLINCNTRYNIYESSKSHIITNQSSNNIINRHNG